MYVVDTLNALNNYPHQVRFEPVRDADCCRRHNWSPGYYGDADASLEHHAGAPVDAVLMAEETTPSAPQDENQVEQVTDGELEMAGASS